MNPSGEAATFIVRVEHPDANITVATCDYIVRVLFPPCCV